MFISIFTIFLQNTIYKEYVLTKIVIKTCKKIKNQLLKSEQL